MAMWVGHHRRVAILALVMLLVAALPTVSAQPAPNSVRRRGPATTVVELTPENYDEYVNPERYTFVLFCTPWARDCKIAEDVWDRFSLSQQKARNRDVFVAAKVNAKKYPQLAKKAGVVAYPTMMYFTPDEPEGLEYRGAREVALLDSFVFQFT